MSKDKCRDANSYMTRQTFEDCDGIKSDRLRGANDGDNEDD